MQIDDGIFVSPLPDDHEDQGGCANDRKRDDEVRFEPVFALTFVENNLQSAQAQSHKSQAHIVDVSFAQLAALEVGRILNEPRGEQDRQNADGDIDEEDPAPGEVVGDPSAEGGADRGSGDDGHSIDRECHASFRGRKGVRENGLLAGLQASAAGALQDAADDQHREVRRESAQERTDGEQGDAAHVEVLASDDGREPAA